MNTNQAENTTFYENLASKVMQHYFPLILLVKVVRIPPRFRRKGRRLHLLLERDDSGKAHTKYCWGHLWEILSTVIGYISRAELHYVRLHVN